MAGEDSVIFPLTPPYCGVWRFLPHLRWEHLTLWIRIFVIYNLD